MIYLSFLELSGTRKSFNFVTIPHPHLGTAARFRCARKHIFSCGTKLEHGWDRCYMWITGGSHRWGDRRAYRVEFKVSVVRAQAASGWPVQRFREWRVAMAGSVNKVILVGNLGKDPEIRRTQDGRPIANLSVATSDLSLIHI